MHAAMEVLESIYCVGFSYKKVGVILSGLSLGSQHQGDFFSEDSKQNMNLMETLDNINQSMGKGTLRYAREGYAKVCQGSKSWCSPRYTTDWDELLKV
jgi:DNA polymerase V